MFSGEFSWPPIEDVVFQGHIDGNAQIRHSKRLRIGSNAAEVTTEILRIHPEVSIFSYTTFNPDDSSNAEIHNKSLVWISNQNTKIQDLRRISNSVFEFYKSEIEVDNETLVAPRAIAIGSRVQLHDNSFVHIPMMEFVADPEFDEQASLEALAPHRGVLLETDNSFHFWGFNLMTEREWRAFMLRCAISEQQRVDTDELSIFDLNYIEESLERDFAALRIYGYPDTEKAYEPRVVEFVR